MPCHIWSALLERYRLSVKAYNDAVADLGSAPGPQFNESWHRAETARTEVGVSRAALLHHEHMHRCQTGEVVAEPEPVVQSTEEWVLGDQGQSGG
jgi:hypothetical protein